MSVLKGITAFKAQKAQNRADQEARERPRAEYFNWKKNKNKDDKDVVYVRFLQEFDDAVDGYNADRGLPLSSVEHQAPGKQGYLRRANCTLDTESQCYACERHTEDRQEMKLTGRKEAKGWGQKRNFYIWALVDYKDGEGVKPVVISRSFNSSFVDDLIQEVEDDESNQITNKMFRITRSGTGTSTTWKLKAAPSVALLDDADVEVIDLEDAVLRKIPYDEQAAYYGAVYKDGDALDGDDDVKSELKAAGKANTKEVTGELAW
jgi:hypothetical protein